ncbi:MAG: hypothetical protein DRO11_02455, partial [Methanobacteriota archaeon]
MGFIDNSVKLVRGFFEKDKEATMSKIKRASSRLPRGASGGAFAMGRDFEHSMNQSLELPQGLMERYADYERMDQYPEISSALDIYADDATIPDTQKKKTVWAICKDSTIRVVIDECLHTRLRVEEDIFGISRVLCKMGNNFAEILIDKDGVAGLNYLPVPTVQRVQHPDGSLVGYVQDSKGEFSVNAEMVKEVASGKAKMVPGGPVIFEPWEVVHWRLQSKGLNAKYGYSVTDAARWVWRRLVMLEDSALIYKLTRSAARFAFYIDVADMPQEEAIGFVNQVKAQHRRKKFINSSGKIDLSLNPMSPQEDFWIPSRGGRDATRIETIAGPDAQMMDDVEYFRDKLLSSLKVPRSHLGFGGETSRASLSSEDVRFARTVMRIQREIRNGLKQVVRVHLAALGIDPDSIDWDIGMTTPSAIFELAQIEILTAKTDLADRMREFVTKDWLLKNIFGFTQDES